MKSITAFYAFIGLLLLQLVCLELHELGHHIVGRLVCGCWGTRDFYNWTICNGCTGKPAHMLATLAGPLVNVILCWISLLLLMSSNPEKKSMAMFLLFANLPIVRWLAVADGGGDEFVALKYYVGNHLSWFGLRALAFILASIFFLPPLFIAYQNIQGRWKPLWFALFCFVPGFFMQPIQNGLNNILERGILSNKIILQIPLLINICFLLCVAGIWVLWRKMHLATFFLIRNKIG